ncbi:hypothetical protein [Olsenella sp. An293]|uniref:hypothetical protein n=1 Tax=Olsenella sp. An293 TaxID=1965626 RepID=UPI000B3751B3|nr:hypothetical protein [Olsenella sp. An293]OUO33876.1 hypothetical protein B5F85_00695 [Olsenella sp. An293]
MCCEGGIVWMVKGEERPFEPLEDVRRPWLEESVSWGAPEGAERDKGDKGDEDDESDEAPTLVWL